MTFYILFSNESKENLMYDANILGEANEWTFFPSRGFSRLFRAVNELPVSEIEKIQIFDETDKKYTIEGFLKILNKLQIRKHTSKEL